MFVFKGAAIIAIGQRLGAFVVGCRFGIPVV
jgi:hypothetical protein